MNLIFLDEFLLDRNYPFDYIDINYINNNYGGKLVSQNLRNQRVYQHIGPGLIDYGNNAEYIKSQYKVISDLELFKMIT